MGDDWKYWDGFTSPVSTTLSNVPSPDYYGQQTIPQRAIQQNDQLINHFNTGKAAHDARIFEQPPSYWSPQTSGISRSSQEVNYHPPDFDYGHASELEYNVPSSFSVLDTIPSINTPCAHHGWLGPFDMVPGDSSYCVESIYPSPKSDRSERMTIIGDDGMSCNNVKLRIDDQNPGEARFMRRKGNASKHRYQNLKRERCALKSHVFGNNKIAKDEFLLRAKKLGLSYREIKQKGGFQEAESTLRGRYRTLTKQKEARVRKPIWTAVDIELLQKAVPIFTRFKEGHHGLTLIDPEKVSWKSVAQYIYTHGGSYLFGNTTCKKKWLEITNL